MRGWTEDCSDHSADLVYAGRDWWSRLGPCRINPAFPSSMKILFSSLEYSYNNSISSYKTNFNPGSAKNDHSVIC